MKPPQYTAAATVGTTTRLVVTPELNGARADVAIAALTGWSRRGTRVRLGEGAVALDGRPLRVLGRIVEAGAVFDVAGELGQPPQVLEPMPTVLWRDRDLLAIDKPAGMLSQPSERAPGERSADQIVLLALAHELGHRPFVRLVHRLDRPTSGVLLFAIDPAATKALATAWERGLVRRTYLALVDGNPVWDERVVDAPIGRPDATWRFAVDPAGEPATTKVRVLERRGDRGLVTCELVTGRTHQVRVHLSSVGHPVLGDTTYGGPPAERMWLHAASLELPHPRSRERVMIESPFPEAGMTIRALGTVPAP